MRNNIVRLLGNNLQLQFITITDSTEYRIRSLTF